MCNLMVLFYFFKTERTQVIISTDAIAEDTRTRESGK